MHGIRSSTTAKKVQLTKLIPSIYTHRKSRNTTQKLHEQKEILRKALHKSEGQHSDKKLPQQKILLLKWKEFVPQKWEDLHLGEEFKRGEIYTNEKYIPHK